ncbi:glycoside hydrolase family 5 protein [Glycocaulis sp.]|uniref:glycoside hydrolase family 5 protein n=1 Tax=Glycocaulis sp. TaxID=1969725 RepID=UPI003F725781
MTTRRNLLAAGGALASSAFAPPGLRLASYDPSPSGRMALWDNGTGPHLRGAVFAQRRVYPELDGTTFLGPGPLGAPVSQAALDSLAEAGANLAVWSGAGMFAETGNFGVDPAIEDHIGRWLDMCQRAGLYTVIGFRTGPGRSAFAFHPDDDWYPRRLLNNSLWHDEEAQAAWVAMCLHAARRFGSHPALAGILAMVEPNGSDLGHPSVWPAIAAAIDRNWPQAPGVPLILSPDRWARAEALGAMQSASAHTVINVHDYAPWEYTHQGARAGVRLNDDGNHLAQAMAGYPRWACLEFGAALHAPDLGRYFQTRIAALESAGANWAAWRWPSGWDAYESRETGMNVTLSREAMNALRAAYRRNRGGPG